MHMLFSCQPTLTNKLIHSCLTSPLALRHELNEKNRPSKSSNHSTNNARLNASLQYQPSLETNNAF